MIYTMLVFPEGFEPTSIQLRCSELEAPSGTGTHIIL